MNIPLTSFIFKTAFSTIHFLMFFWISSLCLSAQNISIQLCPMENQALLHSFICLSTNNGNLVFNHFLTEEEIFDGSSYKVPVQQPGKYNLTIMNEYSVDTLNDGEPFFKSYTYCEIDSQIQILRFKHPKEAPFSRDLYVCMEITNCPPLEVYRHYSDSHGKTFWKMNPGNKLWTQVFYAPGEDIFIVLKAKGDQRYRYIYLESDKFFPHNGFDFTTLDWNQLRTDLSETDITVPFNKISRDGYIKGINVKNNQPCYFYRSDSIKEISGKIIFLFPLAKNFSNITTNLSFITGDELNRSIYNYEFVHGEQIKLEPYKPEYFDFTDFIKDSVTIRAALSSFPDYYHITYIKPPIRKSIVGDYLYHYTISVWHIFGRNNQQVNFTIPDLKSDIMLKFNSVYPNPSRWYFRKFETIKTLNEDNFEIDWINFLYDYNLLSVEHSIK